MRKVTIVLTRTELTIRIRTS